MIYFLYIIHMSLYNDQINIIKKIAIEIKELNSPIVNSSIVDSPIVDSPIVNNHMNLALHRQLLEEVMDQNMPYNNGFIFFHGIGSGKTRRSIDLHEE